MAKELGILTVAVVTRPFPFEGKKRMVIADEGIRALSESVDSLITIPNEKLLTILGKDASLLSAFAKADDVLAGAVRGISDIIKRPGMINVDFADVKTVMSEMGMAMMAPVAPAVRTVRVKPLKPPSATRCWKMSTCRVRAAFW